MPYIVGMKVKLRDKALNRYRNFYGHGATSNFMVMRTDLVQGRERVWLDGVVPMAWAGDLKQASDKKGLGK